MRRSLCDTRVGRMGLVRLLLISVVLVSCAAAAPPSGSPVTFDSVETSGNVACVDLPQAEPNTCDKVVAAVRETHAHHVDTASRVLAVDTCLPQVLCEGAFFYEIVVVLVRANGDTDSAIVLHVFGHVGQSMQVQPWSGPLPAHVAELLKPGS